jgi:hypothetical protein
MEAADQGNCPYCNAVNSYSVAKCVGCGEELPWAQWVQARQQPSQVIGAQRGEFAKRGGAGLSDGISILPSGALGKLALVLVGMVVAFIVMRSIGTALKPVAKMAGTSTNGAPGSKQAIAEQWKKANPVIEQDAQERKESQ